MIGLVKGLTSAQTHKMSVDRLSFHSHFLFSRHCGESYVRNEGPGYLSRYSYSLRAARSGDRIPVGGEIFRTLPDRPWGLPRLLYNGCRVFSVGKAARPWH